MSIRTGILGGMFDPIHIGHCILAEQCIDQFSLHQCYLIPAYQSPLRQKPAEASPYQRLTMARIVARTNPNLRALDLEIRRKGTSYTFDTIDYLRHQRPRDNLYLIIGADQAAQFTQWHRWQDILPHVTICIAPRSEIDLPKVVQELKRHGARVALVDMPLVTISSSMLRARCSEGKTIRYLVHDKVYRYIRRYRLYRDTDYA